MKPSVKIYLNGNDFYQDNKDFLISNKYTEAFFRLDSPQLEETNKFEYALMMHDDKHKIVVLKKEPFNLLFFGDRELSIPFVGYLLDNEYEVKDYLCPTELGNVIMEAFKDKGFDCYIHIGMDFMEAHEKCDVDIEGIEIPTLDDIDELYENANQFAIDCGITNHADKEKLSFGINEFRIIRENGHIVSMAKMNNEFTDNAKKISYVYTKKEYRGRGYARRVVGSILNDIIDSGCIATLNVDQKNPISNHVYASLGFKKVFSQSIFSLSKES